MTSRIFRNLVLAVAAVSALGLSSGAFADRGGRDRDGDRWEKHYRYDDDDRGWERRRHWREKRWGRHHHDHYVRERVVVIEEPRRVYLPPPPVVYREMRPARPVISISVPDIIIPF